MPITPAASTFGVPFIDVSGTGNDDLAITNAIAAGGYLTASQPINISKMVDLRSLTNPQFNFRGTGPAAMPVNTAGVSGGPAFFFQAKPGNPGLSGFSFTDIEARGNGSTGQSFVALHGDGTNSGESSFIRVQNIRAFAMNNLLDARDFANLEMSGVLTQGVDNPILCQNVNQATLSNIKLENGSGHAIQILGTDPNNVHTDEGWMLSNINVNVFTGSGLRIINQAWGEMNTFEITSCTGPALDAQDAQNWRFGHGAFASGPNPAAWLQRCSLFTFHGSSFQLSTIGLLIQTGRDIGVTGCHCNNNSNIDVFLQGVTNSIFSGNRYISTAINASVVETGGSAWNMHGPCLGYKPHYTHSTSMRIGLRA